MTITNTEIAKIEMLLCNEHAKHGYKSGNKVYALTSSGIKEISELAVIAWRKDSTIEKWFLFTTEDIVRAVWDRSTGN